MNKKKNRGFKAAVIVLAVVLVLSFIGTLCFGAALGADAVRYLFKKAPVVFSYAEKVIGRICGGEAARLSGVLFAAAGAAF